MTEEVAQAAAPQPEAPSWFDSLPESIRADQNISKFRGGKLEDFATAYLNAVKLIGAPPDQVVRLDKSQALDILKKLGAPEKPDGYTIKPPEDVPPELAVGDALDWYKSVAAEAGLLPEQAQKIYEAYVRRVYELEQQTAQIAKEVETGLRMKWGQAYEQNINLAKNTVKALGIQEAVAESGLGVNPAFIEAMVKVGEILFKSESGPGLVSQKAVLPPADARAEGKRLIEQAYEAFKAGKVEEARALQKRAAEFFQMLA